MAENAKQTGKKKKRKLIIDSPVQKHLGGLPW